MLGLVEGLMEFLPVSSTGHLTIVERLMGLRVDADGITVFTAIIQVGAIIAVIVYFRRDIASIVSAWLRGLYSREAGREPAYRLAWAVVLGTTPIGIIGLAAKPLINGQLRSLWFVAGALVLWTAVMALGGSYRTHYLVELVPVTALAAAQLSTRTRLVRGCAAGVVALTVASCGLATGEQAVAVSTSSARGCASSAGAATAGRWLAARARPGDSVATVYGGANVLLAAGATSSSSVRAGGLAVVYLYLWSLPVPTLGPSLNRLVGAVSGPNAATWVVQSLPEHSWGPDSSNRLSDAVSADYTTVGVVCGRRIDLRDGLQRNARAAHGASRTPARPRREHRTHLSEKPGRDPTEYRDKVNT